MAINFPTKFSAQINTFDGGRTIKRDESVIEPMPSYTGWMILNLIPGLVIVVALIAIVVSV